MLCGDHIVFLFYVLWSFWVIVHVLVNRSIASSLPSFVVLKMKETVSLQGHVKASCLALKRTSTADKPLVECKLRDGCQYFAKNWSSLLLIYRWLITALLYKYWETGSPVLPADHGCSTHSCILIWFCVLVSMEKNIYVVEYIMQAWVLKDNEVNDVRKHR